MLICLRSNIKYCINNKCTSYIRNFSRNQKQSGKGNAEQYKFSQSNNHPEKLSINKNLNPNQYLGSRLQRMAVPITIISIISMTYFLYRAFTSEYDLEIEEALMKALPGYEKEMNANAKYSDKMKELRRKRDEELVSKENF